MSPPSPGRPRERTALLWLFFTTPIWGTTFPLMQTGIDRIAPLLPADAHARVAPTLLLFLRFLIAGPVLLLVFRGVLRRLNREAIRLGFLLSLPWYGGFLLQIYGIQDSTPAISAFLTSLYVVFVPMVGWFTLRERPSRSVGWGVLCALAGMIVMTEPYRGKFGGGEFLSTLCAFVFTFHILLTDRYSRRVSAEALTLGLMAWGTVYSLVLVLLLPGGPASLAPGILHRLATDVPLLGILVYLSAIASVLAIYVMNAYQKALTPARAALLYTLEPIFAALFSWWWNDEPMTAAKIIGGALILAGNTLAESFGRPGGPIRGDASPVSAD